MEEPHNNHQTPEEDKQSKATSSLFPIKMIAKLEWTQSNAQQNIGSAVVECLTRDLGAAGSSLTSVTTLWSLSKAHLS